MNNKLLFLCKDKIVYQYSIKSNIAYKMVTSPNSRVERNVIVEIPISEQEHANPEFFTFFVKRLEHVDKVVENFGSAILYSLEELKWVTREKYKRGKRHQYVIKAVWRYDKMEVMPHLKAVLLLPQEGGDTE